MKKKLIKHGNSAALIIDKPILEILDIDMKTQLKITTDGENLIISPDRRKKARKKLQKALEKVNKEHSATLKKLAK